MSIERPELIPALLELWQALGMPKTGVRIQIASNVWDDFASRMSGLLLPMKAKPGIYTAMGFEFERVDVE